MCPKWIVKNWNFIFQGDGHIEQKQATLLGNFKHDGINSARKLTYWKLTYRKVTVMLTIMVYINSGKTSQ